MDDAKPATLPTPLMTQAGTPTPPSCNVWAATFNEAPAGTRTSNLGSASDTGQRRTISIPITASSAVAAKNLAKYFIDHYDTNPTPPALKLLPLNRLGAPL